VAPPKKQPDAEAAKALREVVKWHKAIRRAEADRQRYDRLRAAAIRAAAAHDMTYAEIGRHPDLAVSAARVHQMARAADIATEA